jgi:RNA polymerase primary sigma factor
MSRYFHDVAEHPVLSPEEEQALAQDIEALEVELWTNLLAFSPTTDFLVDAILAHASAEASAELKTVCARLARAGQKHRKERTKAARAALERAAGGVATHVLGVDLDKDALKSAIAGLDAYARGVDRKGIRCGRSTRDFKNHLRRVRSAYANATAARDAFAQANLRLVISIARRYANGPMALQDLIQEGNLGLLKAVDRFDHRRGFRFSTFASWWIRHSVGRALADKGREVRVPVHMVDASFRLKKAQRELMTKLGRTPTERELSAASNIPVAKLRQMNTLLLGHSVSMNQPVSNDDERPMVEVFRDANTEADTPADIIDRRIVSRELVEAMGDLLSPMETDIVRRRFGLVDGNEETLQEIADSYSRSRERIRQIQATALDKLRTALSRKSIRAA